MPTKRIFTLWAWPLILFCCLAWLPSAAQAKEAKEPPVKMDDPVILSLGVRLRCPVCQGMPIGESPAPMAQDMMREVRRLRLEEGQSEEAIAAHFTARYGTWVLLDPPKTGFGLLVWLLPPAALMLGVGAALGSAAHKRAVARDDKARRPAQTVGGTPGATDAETASLLAEVRRQAES